MARAAEFERVGSARSRALSNTGRVGTGVMLVIVAMLASFAESWAQSAEHKPEVQDLNLSFAAPIAIEGVPPREDRNPTLVDVVRPNEEPTILLVGESPDAELLVGATRTSFGTSVPLPIKAYRLSIAEGAMGTLWIGGVRCGRVSIVSIPLSCGYLAKVDRRGHFFWEREYGKLTERSIQSVTPLASGDVVVSGKDSDRTWLARISDDGNIVWERFVGIGKGSATTTIDGVITLAALEACQCDGSYRENVAVWSFDQAGKSLGHRVIREGINRAPTQSAAQIRIEKGKGAIYVLSVWMAFQAQPFEIARLDVRRELVWSKIFPETVWHRGTMDGASFPATALLSNDDILFAMGEQLPAHGFVLSRLDATTGDLSKMAVRVPSNPPPPCIERWGPIRFMKEEADNTVTLFGSPPDGQGPMACGWIGEAVLPKSQR